MNGLPISAKVLGEDKEFNTGGSLDFDSQFRVNFPSRAKCTAYIVRLLQLLSTALAGLMIFGCGTPVAKFQINAPSTTITGSPFSVVVTAVAGGRRDTAFDSFIRLTSSDSAAVLPSDYQFTSADAGSHTFNGIILMTPGKQTITATMIFAPAINGSTDVTVSAAASTTQ
jgi:hypothetical protein